MRRRLLIAGTLTLVSLAAACSPSGDDATTSDSASLTTQPMSSATSSVVSTASTSDDAGIVGTVIRFTSRDVHVDVTITNDNATTRDFLSLLPLSLSFEEFNRREKISYLPKKLVTSGSPGHDPDDGDLIYFAPWGNLGFYYDAEGIGYSDQIIQLGTYRASVDQLTGLEGSDVAVAIVE